MALKLTLKPREKAIIGEALITNGPAPTSFFVENKVPILRRKDILTEEEAQSWCEKIYFLIQLMYLDRSQLKEFHKQYWSMIRELLKAAPSAITFVEAISEKLLVENYYGALKEARKLIEFEKERISHVTSAAAS